MERARCDVPAEKVISYLEEQDDPRSVIRVPDQGLNMDETGFCSRPMTAKKTIVYSKVCTTKPASREESDLNHMTLVATTNLLGQRFKLSYMITNKVAIKDPDLQLLSNHPALYQTPKEYEHRFFMGFSVHRIFPPYCENLPNVIHDPTLVMSLIMDNYPSHNNHALLALYAQSNIRVIWLPAPSSHVLQPLDLSPFGELKGR
jgi:hypothetical protein